MKSNYRRIGDYIREIDIRNSGLKVQKLIGLSVTKEFIPSVANIIGTDLEIYKIISFNQFACSTMQVRRDKKMPVALYIDSEPSIVSQAYQIFEVSNRNELIPEYLMLWFTRAEFDREACFHAVGGVRGSLEWEDFCDMELPVPSIEKQREIVAEYNAIQRRIELNDQLIQKLEDTAQTIYKRWFVEFEFPNENGLPYKSNGGEMVWNEELSKEIPKGWEVKSLGEIADFLNGLAMQKYPIENENECLQIIKIRELSQGFFDVNSNKGSSKIPLEYIVTNGDVIFSWSGTLKVKIWCGGTGALNQHLFKVYSNIYSKWFYYLWTKFYLDVFIRIAEGKATSLGHINREHLNEAKVLCPNSLKTMNSLMDPLIEHIIEIKLQNQKLTELKNLLLSKLATVEG
ncbi:MAG: restriction endonuclease subunit S [Candidatus Kapabacteria bacterium]|nr:restriction endonuclease subunit S [Candidatus Kapabacteria bacterium]